MRGVKVVSVVTWDSDNHKTLLPFLQALVNWLLFVYLVPCAIRCCLFPMLHAKFSLFVRKSFFSVLMSKKMNCTNSCWSIYRTASAKTASN